MNDPDTIIEEVLCGLLRGDSVAWPASRFPEFEDRLRDSIVYHGVGPLLLRQLARAPSCDEYISWLQCAARQIKDDIAIELIRKRQLARTLRALAECGVAPLLLKGAALAYSLYPSPALRPRADTDLLIRNTDRSIVDKVLSKLGYEKPNAISGEFVKYQCGYVLRDGFGIEHVLDMHWRISNTQLFSQAFSYSELQSRSVSLVDLGENARGLAPTDALLHACMHRAHHMHAPIYVDSVPRATGDRLIWLYDIHLLVGSMSYGELLEFADLAGQKGMKAVCRDGLLRTRRCFGTQIPEEALVALTNSGHIELSEAHLRRGHMHYLLTELRSLSCWRDRLTLLREHLFPPTAYMRKKYAISGHARLPMLYLKRGLQGTLNRIHDP